MTAGRKHQIIIVGGGAAGITVAARLLRAERSPDVAIIEPSAKHYYQPLWTLVGAGVFPREKSERDEADYIPEGATWVRDAATEFVPAENYVRTRGGTELSYDYLIVAPGLQLYWDRVIGLAGNVGRAGICSNYGYDHVASTWESIRNFRGGTALFTQPNTPVKCGGAPQKIMYLAEDHFRRAGVRDRSRVIFFSAQPTIFQVPHYARSLTKVIARKGIETRFRHDLVEVRPETREAIFENLDTRERVVQGYDLLHVTPPMGPPEFVRRSPLANEAGWIDVDRYTLRHVRYPNVFGLGDASSLPTSKTAAAVRKQAPVAVANLLATIRGAEPPALYDGYTSCPLVSGYGRLILAEFDYGLKPAETFPLDQSKERLSMYWLKAYGLPWLYWHGMLKGRV